MSFGRFILTYLAIAVLLFWWWDRAVVRPAFRTSVNARLPKASRVLAEIQLLVARIAIAFVMLLWPLGAPVFLLLRFVVSQIFKKLENEPVEDVFQGNVCEECLKPCPFCERELESDRGPMHDIIMRDGRFESFHICERCIEEDILRRIEQNEIDIAIDIHAKETNEA